MLDTESHITSNELLHILGISLQRGDAAKISNVCKYAQCLHMPTHWNNTSSLCVEVLYAYTTHRCPSYTHRCMMRYERFLASVLQPSALR